MCDYCAKMQGNKSIFEDYDETAEIIRFANVERYTLLVNGRIDIDINYCPFCGRKLSAN